MGNMNQSVCNICGAIYEYQKGRWRCSGCGAYKPDEISPEEVTLLDVAGQKLREANFLAAEKDYADIIKRYPENHAGYWGRLLAKYNIVYEKNDSDGRMIATCYASNVESIIGDRDYVNAIKYADKDTVEYYQDQANYIERIRQALVKARKEKPYDVFICFKDSDRDNGIARTEDRNLAQDIYMHLSNLGYRVFFSPESLRDTVGEAYEANIFNAISTAKVMLVYGTKAEYIESTWLKSEWTRYLKKMEVGEKKEGSLLVACKGFSPTQLPTILNSKQCFNAGDQRFLHDLERTLDKLIHVEKAKETTGATPTPVSKKKFVGLGIAAVAVVAIVALIFGLINANKPINMFDNSDYGITVSIAGEGIDKDTILNVESITSGDNYTLVQNAMPEDIAAFVAYDISLVADGEAVSPNGAVTVSLPIPSNLSQNNLVLYYVSYDGAKEELDFSIQSGKVVFTTNHFSIYVIAERIQSEFAFVENNDGSLTLSEYQGNATEVVIPRTFNGKSVTSIGARAFDSKDRLTSVAIPDSVTSISANAFYGCTGITSLTIPESVTSIGTSAFYGWNNTQEIIIEGRDTKPDGWNTQWNSYCQAIIVYGRKTISFHANGGEGEMATQYADIDVATVLDNCTFTKPGYTFAGWAESETGEIKVIPGGSYTVGKTESIYHLYALWTKNTNSIIFNANGGLGEMPDQNIKTDETANLSKNTFTKAGYIFAGWSRTSSGDIAFTDEAPYAMGTNNSYTLYAVWIASENSVIFNSNGGTGTMEPFSIYSNETKTLPENTFSRPGYLFVGWSETKDGVVRYEDKQSFTMGTAESVVLYAVWSANTNSLTLFANNGTNDKKIINLKTDEVINLPENQFSKTGYTFAGWSLTDSGEIRYSDKSEFAMSSETNYSLYAIWVPNENELHFNGQGASGSMEVLKIETNDSEVLPNCLFAKDGYDFVGWATSADGPVVYEDGATYSMGTDAIYTLYAVWETHGYTIKYELNNGTNNAENPNRYNVESSTITFKDPSRPGYTFDGWFASDEFDTPVTRIETGHTGDVTVYAKWVTNTNTIIFDSNGGQGTNHQVTGKTDSTITLPENGFTRKGYEFKGWATTANGSVVYNNLGEYQVGAESNVTLYAVWETIEYTITYKSVYGSLESTQAYNVEDDTFTCPRPTRTGYTFDGWTMTDNDSPIMDFVVSKGTATNYELTANWTANQYTVTLDVNGGSGVPNSMIAIYDSSLNLPSPTRSGYNFAGWYIGEELIESGVWTNASEETLKAKWTIINYTIGYVMNGGTNAEANPSAYTYEDIIILAEPTRTGYKFLGWTYDGQSVPTKNVTINKNSMGNRSYTANWEASKYEVVLNADGGSVDSTNLEATYDSNFELPTPTKTGYKFLGWYDGSTLYETGKWQTPRAVSLKASWEANKYTVTYNADGGSVSSSTTEVTYNFGYTFTIPSRADFTFVGWYTEPNGEGTKLAGSDGKSIANWSIADNRTVYAYYSYTVTFVSNGGSDIATRTFYSDEGIGNVSTSKDDRTFDAWYTDDTLESKASTTMALGNTTLYAGWKEEIKPFLLTTSLSSGNYTIKGATYSESALTLPSHIGGKSVATIGNGAFAEFTNLTNVTLPNTIKTIGNDAFKNCTALQSITFPDGLTSIGDSAFYGCSALQSVVIPDSIKSVGADAFVGCSNLSRNEYSNAYYLGSDTNLYLVLISAKNTNIASCEINNQTKVISQNAFYNCTQLTSIIIPNDVVGIGSSAFSGCTNITQVSMPTSAISYVPKSALKTVVITGGTSINNYAFSGCTTLTSITIPEGVTRIGSEAFSCCSALSNVVIPESVTSIDSRAFEFCTSLTKITIPNGVKSIGYSAFSSCSRLSTVVFGSNIESIGDSAFKGCSALTTVSIPNKVTIIAEEVFAQCSKLSSVSIPFGVTNICDDAFVDCTSLASIIIPDSVATIGNYVFSGCTGLTSVTIPAGVTSMGSKVFEGCTKIQHISVPTIVISSIPKSALKTVVITGGTSIDSYAFSGCTSLTSVVIPDSVTQIGSSAFSGCSSLERITLPFVGQSIKEPGDRNQYPIGYIFGTSRYTGGIETTQLYYGLNTSSTTVGTYYIPSSLKYVIITGGEIPYGAFYNCSNIASIVISGGTNNIGGAAFNRCTNLNSIEIPKTVTRIGLNAFYQCTKLENVYITDVASWCNIDFECEYDYNSQEYECFSNPLYYANNLYINNQLVTEVIIPEGVTSIPHKAFYCTNITRVSVPDSVIYVGEDAFNIISDSSYNEYDNALYLGNETNPYVILVKAKATNITSCQINNNTRVIYQNAFYDCSSLQSIDLPATITCIGDRAFLGCKSLKGVTIPSGVTDIGHNVFFGCSSLENIVIPDGVTHIGLQAFMNCTNLKSVTIGSSVERIDCSAFLNCNKVTSVVFKSTRGWLLGSDITIDASTATRYLTDNNYSQYRWTRL